jgi:hypothetical protein
VKVAVVEPAATETEAGTLRLVELDDRFTVAPVEPLTVTVQVAEVPADTDRRLHVRPVAVKGAAAPLTAPLEELTVRPLPAAEAAIPLITPMVAPVLPERVTETVATIPFAMAFVFGPDAMQIYAVPLPAQLTALPAEANAGPVATLRWDTAAG